MGEAKAKGTYDADMKKIEKSALLVPRDLFILGLDSKERAILLDIIEDRHGRWVDDNNVADTSRRMV